MRREQRTKFFDDEFAPAADLIAAGEFLDLLPDEWESASAETITERTSTGTVYLGQGFKITNRGAYVAWLADNPRVLVDDAQLREMHVAKARYSLEHFERTHGGRAAEKS